jgi:hypothetical protein
MPQQVVPASPLGFVAKRVEVTAFLKHPATHTSGLYRGRPRPGSQGSTELLALGRRNHNAYALDDQIIASGSRANTFRSCLLPSQDPPSIKS